MIYKIILISILFFYTCILNVYAIREPRSTAIDSRIKVLVYNPNDVIKFTGYYGYQTIIEFAEDEKIMSISMGDSTSWQIVPVKNRIFIKPIEQDATTNMTIISDKRTYFFELYAESTQDIRDPEIAFNVKFLYPDEDDIKLQNYNNVNFTSASQEDKDVNLENNGDIKNQKQVVEKIDFNHPEDLNFMYSISGNEEIAPIKIFDDGEFTYLQFRDKNYEMPVIFSVDEDLKESIVNSKIEPNYENTVVIEQVFKKLILRKNNKIVCIFNEVFRKF